MIIKKKKFRGDIVLMMLLALKPLPRKLGEIQGPEALKHLSVDCNLNRQERSLRGWLTPVDASSGLLFMKKGVRRKNYEITKGEKRIND